MPDKFDEDLEKLMKMLNVGPEQAGAAPPAEGGAAAPAAPGAAPSGQEERVIGPGGRSQRESGFAFPPVAPGGVPGVGGAPSQPSMDMLKDITLQVKIELGRARMRVQDVLTLSTGKVVEMDRLTGDPLDLYVNGVLVARGEVIVINENFALRITEVVSPDELKKPK